MPGATSATIEAWAVPVQQIPMFDHTYVTSSCGYSWGCFGAASGGTVAVPGGTGNSNIAECLSNPRQVASSISGSTSGPTHDIYADLNYRIEGLCHQATNRVMEPTGRTLGGPGAVKRVGGYKLSLPRYGIYGRGLWARKNFCYTGQTLLTGSLVSVTGGGTNRDATGSRAGAAMHNSVDATMKELFGSCPEIVENKAMMEKLSKILRQSLAAQESLASEFKNRRIGPMVFDGSALAEHKLALSKIKEAIGEDLFYNIFGEEGDYPELLIDPEHLKEAAEHYRYAD